MKAMIKGTFITGTDSYSETTSNEKEFLFVMNKIINNTACNWPSLIECKKRVPKYVNDYFGTNTQTEIRIKKGEYKND